MARTARDVTPEEMEVYRATLRRREAELQAQLAARKGRAWDVARIVARMLREKYAATRVIAFGSLARDTFGFTSDIDLMAYGVEDSEWLEVRVDAEDVADGMPVDVVLAQDATERLLADVQRDGVPLG